MANPTQWEFNNENQARRVQKAFQVAAGLPRRGEYVAPGKGKGRKKIPPGHFNGALGWSEWVVDVDFQPPNKYALQRAAEAAPYEGQTVVMPTGPDVVLPVAGEAVARVGDWELLPNPDSTLSAAGVR